MSKVIDFLPYDVVICGGSTFTLQEYDPALSSGVLVAWHGHEKETDQFMLSFGREATKVSSGEDSDNPQIIKRIKSLKRKKIYLDFKTYLQTLRKDQD